MGALTGRGNPHAETIDSIAVSLVNQRHIAGCAIAVTVGDKTLFARGYGLARHEPAVPASDSTVFQIASSTKPFIAYVVQQLVDEGAVRLDGRLDRYLDWIPNQYRAITLRQLLTHTSGVARDLRQGNVDDFTITEFRRRLATSEPSFAPGMAWEYSNTGYILLGEVVESMTKTSLKTALQRRVFAPIGMRHTAYRVASPSPNTARGYDWEDGHFVDAPYYSGGFGNGGMSSTAADLARWTAGVIEGRILKRNQRAVAWAPARLADGKEVSFPFGGAQSSYGLGWFLTTFRGHRLITHGGAISGFSSAMHLFPNDQLSVIAVCNGKVGDDHVGHADAVARRIAADLLAHHDSIPSHTND